jgi:hypothetical protein
MRIGFEPSIGPGARPTGAVTVVFSRADGARAGVPTGVQFDPEHDGTWGLSFYARPRGVPTRAATRRWLRALHAAGFTVLGGRQQERENPR